MPKIVALAEGRETIVSAQPTRASHAGAKGTYVVGGDDKVRLLKDAEGLGRLDDSSVRIIDAHQALAAPPRQVIDQDLVVVGQRRLAGDKLVKAGCGVIVGRDPGGGDALAGVPVPVRRVRRGVRAVRSKVEEEGSAFGLRAAHQRPACRLIAPEPCKP